MKNNISLAFFFILSILSMQSFAQYPDQQQTVLGVEALNENIESSSNIIAEASTNSIVLNSDAKDGYFILKPMSFDDFFNRGLPSWNGFAPENESSSFKIEMRFEMSYGWSRWITVGYWDNYIWSTYGYTTFTGGKVSIDYVKLDSYIKNYQFKVTFKRNNLSYESPRIEQLSFFVSDLRSDNADINFFDVSLKKRVDIIHYQGVGPSLLAWLPKLLSKRIKVVATIHSADWDHGKWGGLAKFMLKLGAHVACRFADDVISVSRSLQRYCLLKCKRDVIYIPNGVAVFPPVNNKITQDNKQTSVETDRVPNMSKPGPVDGGAQHRNTPRSLQCGLD